MILVVGGSGEIGSAILRQIVVASEDSRGGAEAREISVGSAAKSGQLIGAGTRRGDGPGWIVDLEKSPDTWRLPDRIGTAILAAGVSGFRVCEENPEATRRVNVLGIRHLVAELTARGAAITYLSSSAVFSEQEDAPTEDHPVSPTSEYGRQKAGVEAFLRGEYPNSKIVRLTKVVSPRTPLIKKWREAWQAGHDIEAYGDLHASLISVQAVARAILHIAQGTPSGFFHLSATDAVSYFEAAQILADQLGMPSARIRRLVAPHPNRPETALLGMTRPPESVGFPQETSSAHLVREWLPRGF